MLDQLKQKFLQPSEEFSVIPFWFWNAPLAKQELAEKIADFKSKGIDGFVLHPRIGLPKDIPYMGEKYMDFVKFAVSEAQKHNMKVVLYDEGMYPSGSANGKVVEGNPEFAARGIRMDKYVCKGLTVIKKEMADYEEVVLAAAVRSENNILDLQTAVKLPVNNQEVAFRAPEGEVWQIIVIISTFSHGTIRGIHFGEDDGEENAPLAADLLNEAAIKKFIRLTHEAYYHVLKDYFGTTVMAMFTDEPSILGRCVDTNKVKPWTRGFMEWYKVLGNQELDILSLWFDVGAETQAKRRNYKKAVNKRLELSYYKPLSEWCLAHGIALTGHPEASDDIGCLKYFQIPGQDVVWRWVGPEDNKGIEGQHSTMAKCASDAARHMGRRRNANECFGCCGPNGRQWEFTASDMKWYMDWLFVRGTNLLYPHAFLYSIEGEKRTNERPPDVGPNNSWWKYYEQFAVYAKRMSWLMTDSVNTTSVAVLCEEDALPWRIVKPLYEKQIEFNYLEEHDILANCRIERGKVKIQQQTYRILIIEDAGKLTARLIGVLNHFSKSGGHIIVYNPQNNPHGLMGALQLKDYGEVIQAVDLFAVNDIIFLPGNPDLRISHVIKGTVDFYLLTNEGEDAICGELAILGAGELEEWDAWSGKITKANLVRVDGRYSVVSLELQRRSSLILCRKNSMQALPEPSKGYDVKTMPEIRNWRIKKTTGEVMADQALHSWTEYPELENYSGNLLYETTLDIGPIIFPKKAVLALGIVGEMAEVYINDRSIGVKMWAPYEFDITEFLADGIFKIGVDVTNSISNAMAKTKVSSGLLGPVTIKLYY